MEAPDIKHENINNKQQPTEAERVLGSMPPFEEFKKIESVYHDGTTKEDSQIRAGFLTHVKVDPGEPFESAMWKLDYLKSQGKNAFLIFDGHVFDNYSEQSDDQTNDEEFIDSTVEAGAEKDNPVFEALDNNSNIPKLGKYNLVGVIGGIKQATEFTVQAKNGEESKVSSDVGNLLDNLGLKYVISEMEPNDFNPNYTDIWYHVSKTEELAKRVKTLIELSKAEGQIGEATRELGHLFGFPTTAIEYYIKKRKGEVMEDDGKSRNKKYEGDYVHSPENEKMEYMQYEQKINKLFRKYCPWSADKFFKGDIS